MRSKIEFAEEIAHYAHLTQKRAGTDKPYVTHPIKVYEILKLVTDDEDILVAGLLHDVVEDTFINLDVVKNLFGDRVASLVSQVSKDDKGEFNIKDRDAFVIKLADILHNVSDSNNKEYVFKKACFVNKILEGDM